VFTFQPEGSVAPGFAQRVISLVRDAGGEVLLVQLKLSASGQLARIANADRGRFGKLKDAELLKSLQDQFEACERAMPAPDMVIDTEKVTAETAAQQIAERLN
jgi:hypothetical protein